MEDRELIKVYIDIINGETACICLKKHKRCKKKCAEDVVIRDPYEGWESTMRRNKYGK